MVGRGPEATHQDDNKQSFKLLPTPYIPRGTIPAPDPTPMLKRLPGTNLWSSGEESLDHLLPSVGNHNTKALQVAQGSHIQRLPAELYVELLDYMEPRYGVLLSLTCKKLWSMVSLKSNRVLHDLRRCEHLAARIDSLDLLEKDSPRHVRCTVCMVLHKRQPKEGSLSLRFDSAERKCAEASGYVGLGDSRFLRPAHMHLSREAAELMLRANSRGVEYGLSTSILGFASKGYAYGEIRTLVKFECRGRIYTEGTAYTSSGIARASTPHLLLRTKYQIEVDTEWNIKPQVESTQVKSCGHNEDRERNIIISTVADLIKNTNGSNTSPTYNANAFYQCPLCPTDMEVTASKVPGECFISVTIEAWRDMGGRGKHTDIEWKRQTSTYLGSACPFRRETQYALGQRSLKEVFDAADPE